MNREAVPLDAQTEAIVRRFAAWPGPQWLSEPRAAVVIDYLRQTLAALDQLRAERIDVEDVVARAIYDDMRMRDSEGRNRPWVPGGNSRKQDEARQRARAALASQTREDA